MSVETAARNLSKDAEYFQLDRLHALLNPPPPPPTEDLLSRLETRGFPRIVPIEDLETGKAQLKTRTAVALPKEWNSSDNNMDLCLVEDSLPPSILMRNVHLCFKTIDSLCAADPITLEFKPYQSMSFSGGASLGNVPVVVASLSFITTDFDQQEPEDAWSGSLPATITIEGETGTLVDLHLALGGGNTDTFSRLCERYASKVSDSTSWVFLEVVAEELYLMPMPNGCEFSRPEYLTQIGFGFIYARCKVIATFDADTFSSS